MLLTLKILKSASYFISFLLVNLDCREDSLIGKVCTFGFVYVCVCVCVGCAFVKYVNRGYTHTQFTSTGDSPAIGMPPVQKRLLNYQKRDVLPSLRQEEARIHY